MSGTEDVDLDEVLIGGDYHDALRRISEQSETSSTAVGAEQAWQKRKTVPDPQDFESDDEEVVPPSRRPPTQYDYSVTTPSGARLPVLSPEEVDYYEDRARRYTADHKFSTVTDLQDLDRVLSTELILHRYDIWLTLGTDYWGQAISDKDYLRYVKEMSASLQNLKKSMGLDKATRDKDQGADFVSWLEDVRRRAKEFGIMREDQLTVALTLFHEVKAKLQTFRNADDIEREELGLHADAILDWMWQDVFPRFDKVDDYFRTNSQRFWKEV